MSEMVLKMKQMRSLLAMSLLLLAGKAGAQVSVGTDVSALMGIQAVATLQDDGSKDFFVLRLDADGDDLTANDRSSVFSLTKEGQVILGSTSSAGLLAVGDRAVFEGNLMLGGSLDFGASYSLDAAQSLTLRPHSTALEAIFALPSGGNTGRSELRLGQAGRAGKAVLNLRGASTISRAGQDNDAFLIENTLGTGGILVQSAQGPVTLDSGSAHRIVLSEYGKGAFLQNTPNYLLSVDASGLVYEVPVPLSGVTARNLAQGDALVQSENRSYDVGSNLLSFQNTNAFLEALTLSGSTDRVGVGVSTPTSTLDVLGEALVFGNMGAGSAVIADLNSDLNIETPLLDIRNQPQNLNVIKMTNRTKIYVPQVYNKPVPAGSTAAVLAVVAGGELVRTDAEHHAPAAVKYKVHYSDMRLKENIHHYARGLDFINQLEPRTYRFKSDTALQDRPLEVGLIAQDVLALAPETIQEQEDGYYSLYYNDVVMALMNAVKELDLKSRHIVGESGKIEAGLTLLSEKNAIVMRKSQQTHARSTAMMQRLDALEQALEAL